MNSHHDECQENKAFSEIAISSVKDYAIFSLDPDGIILSWNKGAEQLKGYTPAEIIGKSFTIFYSPEDVQANHPQEMLKAAVENESYEEEGWRYRKDGSKFWADVLLTAIKVNDKLLGFTKVTRDTQRTLRDSIERNLLLNQASGVMTWTCEASGAFNEPQPSWEAFTGQKQDEYLSDQGFGWKKMYPFAEQEKITALWNQENSSLDNKSVETLVWSQQSQNYQHALMRAAPKVNGNKIKWLGLHVSVQQMKENEVTHVQTILQHELLLRAQQAEEFERKRALEAEANRKRYSEYLDRMCHELRNIQNAISLSISSIKLDQVVSLKKLMTKLLKTNPNYAEEAKAIFSEIDENLEIAVLTVDNQSETINNLLDLSKIDNKKNILYPTVINLNLFLEHCIKGYTLQAKNKQLQLSFVIADAVIDQEDIFIFVDEPKLKTIISNLLSNAIKYTKVGFVKLTVLTPKINENTFLEISVSDSGIGIDEKQLPTIFDRFTNASNRVSSSGLGLDLSKSHVENMEGEIWVESLKDIGSKFSFRIPCPVLTKKEVAKFQQRDTPEKITKIKTKQVNLNLKILITDDDLINRKLLKNWLSKLGAICDVATDGLEAVAKYKNLHETNAKNYDVILMDFFMPNMNGDQATKEIRLFEKKLSTKTIIIGLSANVSDEYISTAKNAGMDYYLTKPVFMEILIKLLRDCQANIEKNQSIKSEQIVSLGYSQALFFKPDKSPSPLIAMAATPAALNASPEPEVVRFHG